MISTTSGTEPVNFVRHDTPHPRELKARHQKLFANRDSTISAPVDNQDDAANYEEDQRQVVNNVDPQDDLGDNRSDSASVSSVIIKNDDQIEQEKRLHQSNSPASNMMYQNQSFTDHVDSAVNDNLVTQVRKVRLSEADAPEDLHSPISEKSLRHVGFENVHEPGEDEESQQNEKLNTRLHRRDTPHHLKNKRITSSKEEKDKIETILSNSENNQRFGLNHEEEVKLNRVQLELKLARLGSGLGLSIAGGLGSSPYKGDDEGIFVSRVTENGAAEVAGLRVGDKILAVNNVDFSRIDHHDAVQKLKTAGNEFTLLIEREVPVGETSQNTFKIPPTPPVRTSLINKVPKPNEDQTIGNGPVTNNASPPTNNNTSDYLFKPDPNITSQLSLNNLPPAPAQSGEMTVIRHIIHTTLIRNKNGLGFSISGGKGSTPYKEDSDSVFISRIFEDGPAFMDGKLQVGDKLLSINGQNVDGLHHDQVITKLTGLERFVRLVVERESLVENGDKFSSFAYSSNSYMANRPSYTGSYKRPMLGSVSSLSGVGDNMLGLGTISTPSTPSFSQHKPMSAIFNTKLPGLRSNASSTLPSARVASYSTSSANAPNPSSALLANSNACAEINNSLVNSSSSPQLSSRSALAVNSQTMGVFSLAEHV